MDWYNLILIMLTYFSSFSRSTFSNVFASLFPIRHINEHYKPPLLLLHSHRISLHNNNSDLENKNIILIMSISRLLFPSYFLLVSIIILFGFASSQTLPKVERMYTYKYNHIGVITIWTCLSQCFDSIIFCSGCFNCRSEGVEEDWLGFQCESMQFNRRWLANRWRRQGIWRHRFL